jgi:hypothetical protein
MGAVETVRREVASVKRFEWLAGTGVRVLSLAGVVLTYLGFARRAVGLETALLTLVVALLAILGALVVAFERDVDENFGGVRADLNAGFDRVVAALTVSADVEVRKADGGVRRKSRRTERPGPSGVGALGGATAGGAMGAVFGPAGILLGGLLGGLVGNELEFRGNRSGQSSMERG